MREKLLLLHGALGSGDQVAVIGELLKSKYDVINLNFSGYGGKPLSQDFSIKNFTQDVIGLLDERGIEKIDIFGYSVGKKVHQESDKRLSHGVNTHVSGKRLRDVVSPLDEMGL